jgi:type I restriction-modification system DNA methylase subunit
MLKITSWQSAEGGIDLSNELWWDGPLSLLLGAVILLLIGVFVSNFIGNEIIISGLKGDKKMAEKTEAELKNEQRELSEAKKELDEIAARLKQVEKEILKNNLKH